MSREKSGRQKEQHDEKNAQSEGTQQELSEICVRGDKTKRRVSSSPVWAVLVTLLFAAVLAVAAFYPVDSGEIGLTKTSMARFLVAALACLLALAALVVTRAISSFRLQNDNAELIRSAFEKDRDSKGRLLKAIKLADSKKYVAAREELIALKEQCEKTDDYTAVCTLLAECYAYSPDGMYEEAAREYETALEHDAEYGRALYELSFILFIQQKYDSAQSVMKRALVAGSREIDTGKALRLIKAVQEKAEVQAQSSDGGAE